MRSIPKYIPPWCMSTQHPDNSNIPPFAKEYKIGIKQEIPEMHYVLNNRTGLGCDEVMQDLDGKRACNYLVEQLFNNYGEFFKENIVGEDVYITIRIPNPEIEPIQEKIVFEILASISRSYDIAGAFYGNDAPPPIFEVILPMTTSADSLNDIYDTYKDIIELQTHRRRRKSINKEPAKFELDRINVIPLFEDMDRLINAHNITKEYIKDKEIDHQRVFLARSDPALNYGLVSAVLLNKIALENLENLSKDTGIAIYPIIGVGSAPFRGNLNPKTVEDVVKEYPNVRTLTIQSAFKYDYPRDEVTDAIKWLKGRSMKAADHVDTEECLRIIKKYSEQYQREIEGLAPIINHVAKYVPKGRERRLNVGLFGYSREVGHVSLPRAIPFAAANYSGIITPEFVGFLSLDDDDIDFLKGTYVNFVKDFRDSAAYLNPDSPYVTNDLKRRIQDVFGEVEPVAEHKKITDDIIDMLKKGRNEGLTEKIHEAAKIRKFLG